MKRRVSVNQSTLRGPCSVLGCTGLLLFSLVTSHWSLLAAGELKVGYVNPAAVLDKYQRTKDVEQVLQQKGKQKQDELEGRVAELKKLRQSLELLNDQAKEAKTREIEEKSDDFKRLKARTERELVRERNQMLQEILEEINQAVSEYAKANGFSLILNGQLLLYGEEAVDVTDEILKMLNDRYAAKKAKKT